MLISLLLQPVDRLVLSKAADGVDGAGPPMPDNEPSAQRTPGSDSWFKQFVVFGGELTDTPLDGGDPPPVTGDLGDIRRATFHQQHLGSEWKELAASARRVQHRVTRIVHFACRRSTTAVAAGDHEVSSRRVSGVRRMGVTYRLAEQLARSKRTGIRRLNTRVDGGAPSRSARPRGRA